MNECKDCKYHSKELNCVNRLIDSCKFHTFHLSCAEMRRDRISCKYYNESIWTKIKNWFKR